MTLAVLMLVGVVATEAGVDFDAAMERASLLASRGEEAVGELERGLDAGGAERIAAGYGLALVGDPRGLANLARVLAGGPDELKAPAAAALARIGGNEAALLLAAALPDEPDDLTRVEIADALLACDRGNDEALSTLRLTLGGRNDAGRLAAVVLGERGYVEDAREELEKLSKLPTELGRRARFVLESSVGPKMLKEVMELIRQYYVDPSRAAQADMLTAAAKGLAQSLDNYSEYLDVKDVADVDDLMTGHYGGIGAWVGMRSGVFTIISPIFGGPAYKVGIRSQDQVMEVDEVRTADVPFPKVVTMLKGTPGTRVEVKVWRRGWAKPKLIVITREEIKIESVRATTLRGGVGYVHLVRFSATSGEDLTEALKGISSGGARGLIFDLRYNGGGLLRSSVDVADIFLSGEKLVVSSKGRGAGPPTKRMWARRADDFELPMVVLVNGGSASASEIVAGALQDWRRAVIVGEKTFGKGSVQSLFSLASTGGRTKLKLTIARYYLPSDRSIDGVGVEPDVEIAAPETPGWVLEELEKVRRTGKLEDYAAQLVKDDPHAAKSLAESDEPEFAGFEELYSGFETTFDIRDAVRREVRRIVRRRVAEHEGEEYVVDLAEDAQLRKVHAAFLKVLDEKGGDAGYDDLLPALAPLDEAPPRGGKARGGEK